MGRWVRPGVAYIELPEKERKRFEFEEGLRRSIISGETWLVGSGKGPGDLARAVSDDLGMVSAEVINRWLLHGDFEGWEPVWGRLSKEQIREAKSTIWKEIFGPEARPRPPSPIRRYRKRSR